MSSSNENSTAAESLSRANYYASQLQQQFNPHQLNNTTNQQIYEHQYQLHQQQQQLQQQYQQQLNYNYNSTYSSANFHNSNSSNNSNNNSNQHYHHTPLTNVFPSIYNENNYMSNTPITSNTPGLSGGMGSQANGYSNVQRQIQQDWSNREYIEVVVSNIRKLTDFLNSFELSCRSKLAILDEKLTNLERQIDFIEAKVTKEERQN